MRTPILLAIAATAFFLAGCNESPMPARHAAMPPTTAEPKEGAAMPATTETTGKLDLDAPVGKITKTDAEWRKLLTPEEYHVTREKGTERAFSGKYWDYKGQGVFDCVCCGLPLFSTDTKFESGTGWPSFYAPIKQSHVIERPDNSLFMRRTEVVCARCGAHLGHVFDDGPKPTGLRYCMNSAALKLEKPQAADSE